MCGQAGCGACVVTAYVPKSNSEKGYEAISINSVRGFEILDILPNWKKNPEYQNFSDFKCWKNVFTKYWFFIPQLFVW